MSESLVYGYIYRTICKVNGKRYIGQKKSPSFLGNKYLGSGTLLTRAISKYGEDNFEVELIEFCESKELLDEREAYWIDYYNSVKSDEFYNLRSGGMQPGFSPSVKSHLSNMAQGRIWMNNGQHEVHIKGSEYDTYSSSGYVLGQSESHKLHTSGANNGMYGKTHTEAVRTRLKEINLSNNPSKGKHWYTDGSVNIFAYPDDARLTSEFTRGRVRSAESVARMKSSMQGMRHVNNGEVSIRVPESQLESYLESGWHLGYLHKHRIGVTNR